MNWRGFYINLDRATERNQAMLDQLDAHNLPYERFPAAEGSIIARGTSTLAPGEIGCWHSHWRLLQTNADSAQPLHIIEDDCLLASGTAAYIKGIVDGEHYANYDILLLDHFIPIINTAYAAHLRRRITTGGLTVSPMRGAIWAATTSLLVHPASIRPLIHAYGMEIRNGPRRPIDLWLRDQCNAGLIRIGGVFPFVTSLRLDAPSGIDGRYTENQQLSILAANIARQSFWIGADHPALYDWARKMLPHRADYSMHEAILSEVVNFSIGQNYEAA